MKILIAEDDPGSRRVLERQLSKWGYEVVAAHNGAQAWDYFQNDSFPIVISDWMMPELNGIELVRRIRAAEQHEYVYTILLTGNSEKKDVVHGMEAGADDFLAKPFDPDELQVRLRAGERIIELERNLTHRNDQLRVVNERMKNALESAAVVQQALLPTSLPQVPGTNFAWKFLPCDELAGDFLNVFQLDEKHVGLYVVDVSGHGVAASLLSVTISHVLSTAPSASSLLVRPAEGSAGGRIVSPVDVAMELNRRFQMEVSGQKFFTMVYGILNTETHEFRYVSAGQPPLIHASGDSEQPRILMVKGYPIGIIPDADFEEEVIQLKPGDRLFLYSDGVPEAMNADEAQFGDQRLINSMAESRSLPLDKSVARLLQDVEEWCGAEGPMDDVSILALEIDR